MSATILSVGYPLAEAGLDAVGGSEQILAQIDRGLVLAGWRSLVIAPEGSRVQGTLFPFPKIVGRINDEVRVAQQAACARMIGHVLASESIDLVHFHGLDFDQYRLPPLVPSLASLHLPPEWYPLEVFAARHGPWLLPVSETQAADCPASPRLLTPLNNGVPDELFDVPLVTRVAMALMLTRICPEKGVHLALDAAHRADIDLLIAGHIYPYAEHESYFENQIRPRLDERRRFIGPVGLKEKIALLQRAQCVLVPSLVSETSSLVVREACAMGCPVIAFPEGHLARSVIDHVTGFLVHNADEMADVIKRTHHIDPHRCRDFAQMHFSGRVMVEDYLNVYQRMAAKHHHAAFR